MTTANGSTYETKKFSALGKIYSVLFVSGKLNYVSVSQDNNAFGRSPGKQFKNIDEAISHYKSPEMKVGLLSIELSLTQA